MTSTEKDELVNGTQIKLMYDDFISKNNQQGSSVNVTLTPKRRHTDSDSDIIENDGDHPFQPVRNINKKKNCSSIHAGVDKNKDFDMSVLQGQQGQTQNERRNNGGRGRTIFNSNSQNARKINGERNRRRNGDNTVMNINNHPYEQQKNAQSLSKCKVSQHALHYAVTTQLPPFKILCQPEVKDHAEGTNLIKALFAHIQDDFCKLNKVHNHALGFDTWYNDKQGALTCFTRDIKLFVYLWDVSHYPPKLNNTTITPIVPVHLPPQRSIIFKFVPKTITYEEVLEAVSEICQSKFLLEEMKGSMTNRSRHIRLDLTSLDVMKKLLNGGVFPLNGHLIEVDEFLAPPQLLICSRCNCPGHVKKECKEQFDKCRRCGLNKAQGEHQQCNVKCHHCEGDHLAIDYRCPFIAKYRGELIQELRRRPELLPQDVQLFIPVEFRMGGKNVISNGGVNHSSPPPAPALHATQLNVWPKIDQTLSSEQASELKLVTHDDMSRELNSLRNDYEKIKLEFDRREKELNNKYENYKTKLGAMMNLLVLQNNQQNDCITKVYTVVNEVVPIVAHSLKTLHIFMEKVVNITGDSILKKEFNSFQVNIDQNLILLNDRNDLLIEHQRATSSLIDKSNNLFRQGIELMSVNDE